MAKPKTAKERQNKRKDAAYKAYLEKKIDLEKQNKEKTKRENE